MYIINVEILKCNIIIDPKFIKKNQCLQRGLNSRPLVYKTSALPLSYRGFWFESFHLARKTRFELLSLGFQHGGQT